MKIVLDAGHGYHTPGKRTPDGSMREWEFNHAVAVKLKQILEQYEGVEIKFAHDPTGKVDVPRKERIKLANDWKADFYISIHANADGNGSNWTGANGIETFISNNASQVSLEIAAKIQNELIRETGRRNRGLKRADFDVITYTKMPAALVECGFMTNKEEAELLKSDTYRTKVANALAKAIIEHFKLKPKNKKEVVSSMSIKLNPPQQRAKDLLVKYGIMAADYEIKHQYELTMLSMMTQLVKVLEKNGVLK
jgi:N-acetylmuramoyl-L-alanine amidase